VKRFEFPPLLMHKRWRSCFRTPLKWDKKELNKFIRDNFKDLTVDETTIEFLTSIGLPDSAAPFVSFDRKELRTIEQIYSTGNLADNFLVDIGSDGAGDPICIDMQENCKIIALDHEDNFERRFVNTSVRELFAFLTIYKEFADKLIQLRGDFAFLDSNFTDDELNEFLEQLKSVDNEALKNDDTFWSREIQTLKANRVVQ
jgi:hypothetical protein